MPLKPTTAPTPNPTAAPTTAPAPIGMWRRRPDQAAFRDAEMFAVVRGSDRFVAVGRERSGDGWRGVAWWSSSGATWRRVSVPSVADTVMTGVIRDAAGYVAWGSQSHQWIGFWTSPDGRTWSKTPDDESFRDVEISGVARLGDELVALGWAWDEAETGSVLRAWVTTDGSDWEPVSMSVTPVTSNVSVAGVIPVDHALLAWGAAVRDGVRRPVVLRSTDGRRWEVHAVGEEAEGIGAMIDGAHAVLAVGGHGQGEAGSPPPWSDGWRSTDGGRTWAAVSIGPGDPLGPLSAVVWDGAAFVAMGMAAADTTVVRSTNGRTWRTTASAPDTGKDGEHPSCTGGPCPRTMAYDLAASHDRLVAVGSTETDDGDLRAVVWTAMTSD